MNATSSSGRGPYIADTDYSGVWLAFGIAFGIVFVLVCCVCFVASQTKNFKRRPIWAA